MEWGRREDRRGREREQRSEGGRKKEGKREGERKEKGGTEGKREKSYREAGGKSNVATDHQTQWNTTVLVLTNLHLHLQPSRPKESLINHVNPIGHSDKQDIVQLLYSINLGKERRRWKRRVRFEEGEEEGEEEEEVEKEEEENKRSRKMKRREESGGRAPGYSHLIPTLSVPWPAAGSQRCRVPQCSR